MISAWPPHAMFMAGKKTASKNCQNNGIIPPDHFNKLDLLGFLQDKEITQVEMEDAEPDQTEPDSEQNNPDKTGKYRKTLVSGSYEEEDEVRFLTKRKSDKFAVFLD